MAPGDRVRVFLRSLAIQGSWNYRTLLGAGFAFALLPALRRQYEGDAVGLQAAVTRHASVFNAHPYLSPMALGAVATLEEEGEGAGVVERFKAALRGSLGTVGDRLFWAGLRPVALLLAMVALFFGVVWWAAGLLFLVLYNVAHLWTRVWAFGIGLGEGKKVAERLRRSHMEDAHRTFSQAGPFLAGMLVPTAASFMTGVGGGWGVAVAAVVGLGAAWLGVRIRRPIELGLMAFVLFALILGASG